MINMNHLNQVMALLSLGGFQSHYLVVEVVAMTPAYRKMLQRLEDKVELYKLHVKHYHMSPTQFRRRVSMLKLS